VDQECETHQTRGVFAPEEFRPRWAEAFPVVGMLLATEGTAEDEVHVSGNALTMLTKEMTTALQTEFPRRVTNPGTLPAVAGPYSRSGLTSRGNPLPRRTGSRRGLAADRSLPARR
jgi:hypothetical protein